MTPRAMMEEAGLDPERVRRVQSRADAAEVYVAGRTGGRLRPEFDKKGDVDLPDGRVVDVKRVEPGFRFVNGGAHRPRANFCVVVEDGPEGFKIVGAVRPKTWRHEAPTGLLRPGMEALVCWMVKRSELTPVPAGVVIGLLRRCPACADDHPAGTTCAGGWAPYEPAAVKLPWEDD